MRNTDLAIGIVLVGVGNVGTKVALRLVETGIPWLLVVDFDVVTQRNLVCCREMFTPADLGRAKVEVVAERIGSRGAERLQIIPWNTRVEEIGFGRLVARKPFILVGAVDTRRARLALAQMAVRLGAIPYVDLAIDARPSEKVAAVRVTQGAPCLIEAWSETDWALLDQALNCAGDPIASSNSPRPVASEEAGHLAAKLAADACRRLLDGDDTGVGHELRVDGNRGLRLHCRLPKLAECPLDHDLQIHDAVPVREVRTIGDLFDVARRHAGPDAAIHTDRGFVESPVCRACGEVVPGLWAMPHVRFHSRCPRCGGPLAATVMHSRIDTGLADRYRRVALAATGLPDGEIVLAKSSQASVWFELGFAGGRP